MFRTRKNKGTTLLAVIAFVILTTIIIGAFLVYAYNQYRVTLRKILYEKTFYFALSGIAWGKVLVQAGDSRLDNPGDKVILSDWGNTPDISLRFFSSRPDIEYPDLPYSFQLTVKRDRRGVQNLLIAFCQSEIAITGGIKVYTARRIEVTWEIDADNKLVETSWTEKFPPGTADDL